MYEVPQSPEREVHERFVSFVVQHHLTAELWDFVGPGPLGALRVDLMKCQMFDTSLTRDAPGTDMMYGLALQVYPNASARQENRPVTVVEFVATNTSEQMSVGFGDAEEPTDVASSDVDTLLRELDAVELRGDLLPI